MNLFLGIEQMMSYRKKIQTTSPIGELSENCEYYPPMFVSSMN